MDIKNAHMLVNNITAIPEDHDDLWWYLRTFREDLKKGYKPTKMECLEHLELKVDEQIRQWQSIKTRIKNYHEGLTK